MTMATARRLACSVVLLGVLGPTGSLHAQIGVGTWVRKTTDSMPGSMTMTVETCCNGGRRLTYHINMGGTPAILTIASPFDGSEAPVMLAGKPSGETMAITRVDDHHVVTVAKMNGKPFGTSKATISPDGKLLTVLNDFSSPAGGQTAGKFTEIWVKQ
jgi:hypothetical protein